MNPKMKKYYEYVDYHTKSVKYLSQEEFDKRAREREAWEKAQRRNQLIDEVLGE